MSDYFLDVQDTGSDLCVVVIYRVSTGEIVHEVRNWGGRVAAIREALAWVREVMG